ncbi:MAG TPA: GNAT family N-acetyltransferase, partial [Bacteroidia bacterium]|nr:GNAT family N-acetyltransferase [Bacteroidia bacterium]
MICLNKNPTDCIGCIDLFNFDAEIKKAGIGILISEEFRKNGFASEALKLLITHCFNKLYLRQLYCNIHADNIASLNLFKKNGFSQIKNENDTLLLEITN